MNRPHRAYLTGIPVAMGLAMATTLLLVVAECVPPTTTTTTSSTTTVEPESRPNILVVLTDDQGCDQHSTYLCDQVQHNMPFLASLPGGNWYVSRQTRYHGSLCCPDRATILSGQTSAHNGQYGNANFNFDDTKDTLAIALHDVGYSTGLFGKYLNPYPGTRWRPVDGVYPTPTGWDRWLASPGERPAGYDFLIVDDGASYTVPKTNASSFFTYWIKDRMIPWIDQAQASGRPWFAYYAPHSPHANSGTPMDVAPSDFTRTPEIPNWHEGCAGATDPSIADKPSFRQSVSCREESRNENLPMGQVAIDRSIRDVYEHLASIGALDNTVILFLGDNGVLLGSHGGSRKECPYEECHTNPFMIKIPGRPGGDIDRMVSNTDVMPTLLDLADATTGRAMDGQSLLGLIAGTSTWRTDQYLHHGVPPLDGKEYDAVRDDCVVKHPCYEYITYGNGERELYDLTADPYQLTNLLPNPSTGYRGVAGWDDSNPVVQDLATRLAAHVANGA